MDTTKTYTKMCEKSEEIQKLFNPDNRFNFLWDYSLRERCQIYYRYSGYKTFDIWSAGYAGKHVWETDDGYEWTCIWLPRQDQLQEMLAAPLMPIHLIHRLNEWWQGLGYWLDKTEWSMEQLWLAFVMKEKYNKVWSGEVWVLAE